MATVRSALQSTAVITAPANNDGNNPSASLRPGVPVATKVVTEPDLASNRAPTIPASGAASSQITSQYLARFGVSDSAVATKAMPPMAMPVEPGIATLPAPSIEARM